MSLTTIDIIHASWIQVKHASCRMIHAPLFNQKIGKNKALRNSP